MAYDTFIPVSRPGLLTRYHFSELDLLSLRVMLLHTVALVKNGDTEAAANQLADLLRFQSLQLITVNEAVSKAVDIAQYKLSLSTAAFLLSKTPPSDISHWRVAYDALTLFEQDTISVASLYERELAMYANDFDHVLNHSSGFFITLLRPLFYKPNKTLNTLYAYVQLVSNQLSIEDGRFVKRDIDSSARELLGFSLNNYLGNLLIKHAVPRFINLEEAMHELNYLERLLQLSYNAKSTGRPAPLNTVISPYTGEPAYLTETQICIAGESAEERDICLYF